MNDIKPVFYYRPTCGGEMYEGPHHAASVGGRMLREEKPGEWKALVDAADVAALVRTLRDALADQQPGETLHLYALTPDDVAAVNKRRARLEWVKRETARCRCDHNEYCQHCWPESFRPGGMWHGLGA